jgi:6-phosphogluconolactonase
MACGLDPTSHLSFQVERFPDAFFPQKAAARIAAEFPESSSIVLTGGTTAEKIYRPLAETGILLTDKDVFFSDERCVPPDDDASNYAMAHRTLLEEADANWVHRMLVELPPDQAAADYSEEVRAVVPNGFDLLLLGMGADCHIGAMSPGSPALEASDLCVAVDRTDGMKGLTLTPPAVLPAKKVLLLVSGKAKAEAVARVINGNDPIADCPARLLADHPDATFLLDEAAASQI